MADDSYSASQLRQRMQTAKDDELSASQLRARQGITGNSRDWSSQPAEGSVMSPSVVVAIIGLLFAAAVFVFLR